MLCRNVSPFGRCVLLVLDSHPPLSVSRGLRAEHSRIHPGFQPEGADEFLSKGFGKLLLVEPTEV
jgi:hypothetical protein